MLSVLAPPRSSAIAFDAGSTGVRACQLTSVRGGMRVVDTLEIRYPTAGAPAAPAGDDPPASVLTAALPRLDRLVGQAAFQGSEVALVLSPPDVRYQTLRIADGVLHQPEARIIAAIKWEVARERRCEPHDLEVRYWRLPVGHQHNVMAVSILCAQAQQWFDRLAASRLWLKRIDGAPSALARLGVRQISPSKRDLWAVLDIGLRRASLTLMIGEVPTYVRAISVGGDDWTRTLAQVFETSPSEAERIKRESGITSDGDDEVASIAFASIRDSLTDLVRQIELCFGYVVQNYAETHPTALLLTGGGAALAGLDEYLALHVGVPVQRLAAPPVLHPDPASIRPSSLLAAGAALLDLEGA